ncbi:MAG: cobalamin biosynthesis protein [Halocynthiibacter sp.]
MTYVLGLGFRENAPLEALLEVAHAATMGHADATLIATLDRKARTPQCRDLAAAINAQIQIIPEELLKGVKTPTQSEAIFKRFGTGSLAEACALTSRPNATLITPRVTSQDGTATAALAYLETDI